MEAGANQEQWVGAQLDDTDLIISLISSHYFEAKSGRGAILNSIIQRHQAGKAKFVPIIIREVLLDSSQLAGIHCLPRNKPPVAKWKDREAVWYHVVEEILRLF